MKLLGRHIERGNGYMYMEIEDEEDVWHAFNLIAPGDLVRASTVRKVARESSTGSVASQRVHLQLFLRVTKTSFLGDVPAVVVRGRCTPDPETGESAPAHLIKNNQFHKFEFSRGSRFSVRKEEWDSVSYMRIKEACDTATRAEIAAVVMQEGLASVCLMRNHMTTVCQRIERSIPKKRRAGLGGSGSKDRAVSKFYAAVYQAIVQHFDLEKLKLVILASPGFVKDDFIAFLNETASRERQSKIVDNKSKFIAVGISSGHLHSLREALRDPNIANRLKDARFAAEANALDEFYNVLQKSPNRAHYGPTFIGRLVSEHHGVIDKLLISDHLFRAPDPQTRRKYISLVDSVKRSGSTILVYSSLHSTGQQLNQLTGIAAILKYPVELEIDDNDAFFAGGFESDCSEDDFGSQKQVLASIESNSIFSTPNALSFCGASNSDDESDDNDESNNNGNTKGKLKKKKV